MATGSGGRNLGMSDTQCSKSFTWEGYWYNGRAEYKSGTHHLSILIETDTNKNPLFFKYRLSFGHTQFSTGIPAGQVVAGLQCSTSERRGRGCCMCVEPLDIVGVWIENNDLIAEDRHRKE